MREREINSIAVQFKKEAVVPFWMWNDELEKNELLRQLQEIKKKSINQKGPSFIPCFHSLGLF